MIEIIFATIVVSIISLAGAAMLGYMLGCSKAINGGIAETAVGQLAKVTVGLLEKDRQSIRLGAIEHTGGSVYGDQEPPLRIGRDQPEQEEPKPSVHPRQTNAQQIAIPPRSPFGSGGGFVDGPGGGVNIPTASM